VRPVILAQRRVPIEPIFTLLSHETSREKSPRASWAESIPAIFSVSTSPEA